MSFIAWLLITFFAKSFNRSLKSLRLALIFILKTNKPSGHIDFK